MELGQATPYIIFTLTQIVAFIVWIINLQTKITKMESKIEEAEKQRKSLYERLEKMETKTEENHNWFRDQLNKANEALAVAKSVMEGLVLKEMKTKRA